MNLVIKNVSPVDFQLLQQAPMEKKNEQGIIENELSSRFSLYATKIFNCTIAKTKQFIGGVATSSITLGGNMSIGSMGQYFKIIPETPCFFWNDYYDNLQKNSALPMSQLDTFKSMAPISIIGAGIGEELVFRGVVQDLILTKLLGKAIKTISPENASWIDTKTAKIFRIVITSALFAGAHLITGTDEIPSGIKFQAFSALVTGFILGAVKESRLGLMGSIGCHMMHNAAAMGLIYTQCISNQN